MTNGGVAAAVDSAEVVTEDGVRRASERSSCLLPARLIALTYICQVCYVKKMHRCLCREAPRCSACVQFADPLTAIVWELGQSMWIRVVQISFSIGINTVAIQAAMQKGSGVPGCLSKDLIDVCRPHSDDKRAPIKRLHPVRPVLII